MQTTLSPRHRKPDALSVNLVVRDNGLGLSRDAQLLADALKACGCTVHMTPLSERDEQHRWRYGRGWRVRLSHLRHAWQRRLGRAPYDVNIMFEHLWPLHLPLARYNIALPNPEWFDAKDMRHLHRMDHIWAKTQHAEKLFRDFGCATTWVGFDSADNYVADVPRTRQFFHLAGGSQIKGTERLLALWRKHPQWPTLTVLQQPSRAKVVDGSANLDHRAIYLSPNDPAQALQLNTLQNSHVFHICPSETDGWGHYLVEAMGVGAIVITVDAEPMKELVDTERGLRVAYAATGKMGQATTYYFDEAAMETAITRAVSMSDEEIASKSSNARHWFIQNHAGFAERVRRALEQIEL